MINLGFGAKTPRQEPEAQERRLDSDNLLISELVKGKMYNCYLSGDRKVQYIGNGVIKWYNHENDEYRTDSVTDYQLREIRQ